MQPSAPYHSCNPNPPSIPAFNLGPPRIQPSRVTQSRTCHFSMREPNYFHPLDHIKTLMNKNPQARAQVSSQHDIIQMNNTLSTLGDCAHLDSLDDLHSIEPHTDTNRLNAKMNTLKKCFNAIQWLPHKSDSPTLDVAVGNTPLSSVPAIQIQTHIAAKPESIYATLLDHIHEYENWLPIIKSMKVVDIPSPHERILSIETHGKFGFGKRTALAKATFQSTADGTTQLHIAQLPPEDSRYNKYPQFKKNQMKFFETLMEFTPSKDTPGSVDLKYENHTDPNIPRVPRFILISESMKNHAAFVEKCSLTLVNSQHNT